jgi:hypothetical protein
MSASQQALAIQVDALLNGEETDPPPPFASLKLKPPTTKGGQTPAYPILTEEIGYPPSPLAARGTPSAGGSPRSGSLGPIVANALQGVLSWKIKPDDPTGFVQALKQSFKLQTIEGAVVSTWTPRSYAVQADLSSGMITGAQASIYTLAKTLLD